MANIELEFAPKEEDDRTIVCGQEHFGDSLPWTAETRSSVLVQTKIKNTKQFPMKTMEAFPRQAVPTRGGTFHGGSE